MTVNGKALAGSQSVGNESLNQFGEVVRDGEFVFNMCEITS